MVRPAVDPHADASAGRRPSGRLRGRRRTRRWRARHRHPDASALLLRRPSSTRSGADAVVEVNDPAMESALVDELEMATDIVRQGPLTATDDDRSEKKVQLVDQPCGDRL